MNGKIIFLLVVVSWQCTLAFAQCPPKDSLQLSVIKRNLLPVTDNAKMLSLLLSYRDGIVKCGYPKDEVYAWLLNKIALRYKVIGDFTAAASYLVQSIEVTKLNTKGGEGDTLVIPQYYWLSVFYDSLNNIAGKRKAIDSCLQVSDRLQHPYDAATLRCLLDRLQYFFDIGEYRLCINDAEICEKRAWAYVASVQDQRSQLLGKEIAQNSFHWRINAMLAMQDFAEATQLLASKTSGYKKSREINNLALTYAQLAVVYQKRQDYSQALLNFNLALINYKQINHVFNTKQTLRNIGHDIYFTHVKDYNKALLYFKAALKCINRDERLNREDSVESLNIYGHIANVYVQKNLFDTAFVYFQLAFDQIRKGINPLTLLSNTAEEFIRLKKIDYLVNLVIDYGIAYRKKYAVSQDPRDLNKAIDIYTVADKLLARINIAQFEPDSKLSLRRDSRRLYENAIEACYVCHNTNQAFYFFERSRAVLLNIQLAAQNWMGNADIAALSALNRKISALKMAVADNTQMPATANALQDSLRICTDQLYNLLQLIKTRNPLYYQNQDTSMPSVHDVRVNILKDRQAVLEMFTGDHVVYSLLITAKNAVINIIDKTDFDTTASLYTAYLANHDMLNKDFAGFRKTASHLYKLIAKGNPIPEGRIIISPEGKYFPFESLVTNDASPEPDYFLSRHAVSYTYSVRYLFNNFMAAAKPPAGNFLGVAPVRYPPAFHLTALTGSDLSLEKIAASLAGSTLLLAENATKNNFFKQYDGYKIIQLYTHASDSSRRKEPVIYFNDTALYLSELVPEEKPATSLIVLSACETGNGQLYQGEGVFSFNRGFAALGVPSSVTNLWSVNNQATYQLTELFYTYLSDGLPLDIALQKAKLAFISNGDETSRLPYYWAAPILVGKTDFIALDKPVAWKWLIAVAGILVPAMLGWRKFRKKKMVSLVPGTMQTAP